MDPLKFIRDCLVIFGITENELNDNVAKVFYVVVASIIKDREFTQEQQKKIWDAFDLLNGGKQEGGVQLLKTVFSDQERDSFGDTFSRKLVDHILDMANKLGDSLSEEQKQKLAGLINGLIS